MYSRSTVSNSRNPLAVWIELWIPVGRVTDMSFVLVDAYASSWLVKTHHGSKSALSHTRIVGQLPLIEMPNRQYHKVVILHCPASIHNILIFESPLRLLWLPSRLQDFAVEPNLIVDPIFSCDALPVGKNFGTLCILLAPLSVRRETGLVDICRNIAAHTRVSIFKPRTTLGVVR